VLKTDELYDTDLTDEAWALVAESARKSGVWLWGCAA
jgi:hypothetical protein